MVFDNQRIREEAISGSLEPFVFFLVLGFWNAERLDLL